MFMARPFASLRLQLSTNRSINGFDEAKWRSERPHCRDPQNAFDPAREPGVVGSAIALDLAYVVRRFTRALVLIASCAPMQARAEPMALSGPQASGVPTRIAEQKLRICSR